MSQAIHLDPSAFTTEVLNSEKPVLVDLWAPWCGPCKQLAPLLDEIARENVDRFKITKLDVEKHPEIASQFGVRGIPTLLFFKNGTLADQVVGLSSKKNIVARLDALNSVAA